MDNKPKTLQEMMDQLSADMAQVLAPFATPPLEVPDHAPMTLADHAEAWLAARGAWIGEHIQQAQAWAANHGHLTVLTLVSGVPATIIGGVVFNAPGPMFLLLLGWGLIIGVLAAGDY